MNKYNYQKNKPPSIKDMEIHPVWRGIGFVLLIITPIIAYFGSVFLIEQNAKFNWIKIPADMIAKNFTDPYLYIKIFLTIVFIILIYSLYTFITFLSFSLFGPSRYGIYDVPNVSYKRRKITKNR